eukprot:CAMPEP_0171603278 /NCGR_PEP_ID=MMETSP0990-20121206/5925_1 /TAXON_ID=483369 /ORGANISM="non described non described, Strain CCMP2098" /LENGTH=90 /DNA_ID=CAMNT_0012165599 /DNA_START=51 /DNA_END=323 /DNA_ORIENTATION=+
MTMMTMPKFISAVLLLLCPRSYSFGIVSKNRRLIISTAVTRNRQQRIGATMLFDSLFGGSKKKGPISDAEAREKAVAGWSSAGAELGLLE